MCGTKVRRKRGGEMKGGEDVLKSAPEAMASVRPITSECIIMPICNTYVPHITVGQSRYPSLMDNTVGWMNVPEYQRPASFCQSLHLHHHGHISLLVHLHIRHHDHSHPHPPSRLPNLHDYVPHVRALSLTRSHLHDYTSATGNTTQQTAHDDVHSAPQAHYLHHHRHLYRPPYPPRGPQRHYCSSYSSHDGIHGFLSIRVYDVLPRSLAHEYAYACVVSCSCSC